MTPKPSSLVAVATLMLGACGGSPEGPEQEIRDWVRRGEAAVEAQQRGRLMDMIAQGYVDERGQQRDDLGRLLRAWFLRQDSIAIDIDIESIDVFDGTAANVDLIAGFSGSGEPGLWFDRDRYRFTLELDRGNDDWLLRSASWQPAEGTQ